MTEVAVHEQSEGGVRLFVSHKNAQDNRDRLRLRQLRRLEIAMVSTEQRLEVKQREYFDLSYAVSRHKRKQSSQDYYLELSKTNPKAKEFLFSDKTMSENSAALAIAQAKLDDSRRNLEGLAEEIKVVKQKIELIQAERLAAKVAQLVINDPDAAEDPAQLFASFSRAPAL